MRIHKAEQKIDKLCEMCCRKAAVIEPSVQIKKQLLSKNCQAVFLSVFSICLFFACATKKYTPAILKKTAEYYAVVQVCDKFQLSYQDLPCTVYLSDGSSEVYKTNIDGKIVIRLLENQKIIKLVYNFENYRRKGGEILAVNDFMSAKKLKFNPVEKFAVIETHIIKNSKTLFVLIR